MAERKRIQASAKRSAGPSAKTFDRGFVRTRRSLVVGSIVFVVVAVGIVAGIVVWSLNRVPETSQETPTTAGRSDLAHVTESPSPRAAVEALEEEALDAVRQLIEALPKSSDPLALMGAVQVRFGNTPEAMQWWEQSLKINDKRPDVYDGMAKIAEAKGQYAKAVEWWTKVLQINPRLPGIGNKLANVLINSGKMSQAIAILEKEFDISPKERSLTHFLLGKAYLQLREYDKAQKSYEASVAIQPKYASAWFGLATAHARLGHSDQSRKSMEKYRQFFEKSVQSREESLTGRVSVRDAGRSQSQKHSQRDLASVRQLVALAHTSVGVVYSTKGYLHKAKPHWQRAAELDPKDARCRLELASLYRNGGKYDKAVSICEQLVKIDPTNAVFHFNLGILYAEMNRLDAALAEVQRAIDIEPDSPKHRQAYQQIQERRQRERKN